MNDHCEVRFTPAATRELSTIARKEPRRAVILRELLVQVDENGWKLSIHADVIKVLREQTCVGEIRDVGRGGYRLFMFWHDTDECRELWICRVLPKRDVEGKRRLSEICDSVETLRGRFLDQEDR